jgi:hypothetical protein
VRDLEAENGTLRLYYKDWREQRDVVARLRAALAPFAEWAACCAVKSAEEPDEKDWDNGESGERMLELAVHVGVPDPLRDHKSPEIFRTAASVFADTRSRPRNPA